MINLNELKTTELKQLGKQFQLKGWWNMKKEELISTIEKVVSASDEALEILNEYEKEKAAIEEYIANWTKYTKRHNVSEFLEKWKSGEIVLESERAAADNEQAEAPESRSEDTSDIEHRNIQDEPENATENESEAPRRASKREIEKEKIAKENIENAYNWIVGGYENSVSDGDSTEEEFKQWIENDAVNEIYDEAITSTYGEGYSKPGAPKGMKSVSKKLCLEYIVELFKNDGYDVNLPEIKAGHKPTPKRGALIEFNGKSQNICAWGKELGISANTLYGRIYKLGWSVEKAFTKK